jgi:hypothetical protein
MILKEAKTERLAILAGPWVPHTISIPNLQGHLTGMTFDPAIHAAD